MTPNRGPKTVIRCSSFDHPQNRLVEFINSHYFNHSLEIVLPSSAAEGPEPETPRPPLSTVLPSLEAGSFYAIRAKLCAFLEPLFLEAAIETAEEEFCALTVRTPLDSMANGAAITPDGQLHIRLSQEAYEKVGLVGQRSALDTDVYRVQVDLRSKNFRSRGQHYQRVLGCLESNTGPVDFICLASKGGQALLQHGKPGQVFGGQLLHNAYSSQTRRTAIPPLQNLQRSVSAADTLPPDKLQDALEWLGRLSLSETYEAVTLEGSAPGTLNSHRWTGFILPKQVEACITEARNCVDKGQCPWAVVTVWGFADTPVSWAGAEHSSRAIGGENDYVVLVLPGGQFVLFVLSGACDSFRRV